MSFPPIETIIELVHKTRPLIMDTNNARQITVKGQADFVTRVDTSVQSFLKDALSRLTPDIAFMGEGKPYGFHRSGAAFMDSRSY